MSTNNGVRNSRAHPIMIPVIIPAKPVFAPLSWFTADLENDPAFQIEKRMKSFLTYTNKINKNLFYMKYFQQNQQS